MKRPAPSALANSVRDRLKMLADRRREDFQDVLLRFGLERMLYRLSRSEWRDRFVLKGAMLFTVWADRPHRSTRDVDLLGFGTVTVAEMEQIFRALCAAEVEPDGMVFRSGTVAGERIRANQGYAGVRITMEAELARAVIPLQFDIGAGDRVVPAPRLAVLPVLLGMPAPRLRVYSRYSVVAEKLQILVEKGLATSRMKDFVDLAFLSRTYEFDGPTLVRAVRTTFEHRVTSYPPGVPEALGDAFISSSAKLAQWRAFVRRSRLADDVIELADIVPALCDFLLPSLAAARDDTRLGQKWIPGKGWRTRG
jgi:predicted nucleotidyltransferase component of viral defense system